MLPAWLKLDNLFVNLDLANQRLQLSNPLQILFNTAPWSCLQHRPLLTINGLTITPSPINGQLFFLFAPISGDRGPLPITLWRGPQRPTWSKDGAPFVQAANIFTRNTVLGTGKVTWNTMPRCCGLGGLNSLESETNPFWLPPLPGNSWLSRDNVGLHMPSSYGRLFLWG